MKRLGKFAMGAGLSATASYVWTLIPGNTTFSLASNPIAFLEHYHWGLASMVVARHAKFAKPYKAYLNGFGAGMILVEAVGSMPFGIGKTPEQAVPATIIGFTLLALLL